jgi:hypothetical protein
MSLGFGPKIYLRGVIPLYSNMVALATDLLCGGVSHFGLLLHISCLYGNVLMFGYFLGFIWIFANMST